MKQQIEVDAAASDYGVFTNHEKMDNGELCFRLMAKDGSGYIRTVSAAGWQNSHYHHKVRETSIVETGWMALAILRNGTADISVYRPGEIVTTEQGVIHNVYLPAEATIHTVKHGGGPGADWHPSSELDALTAHLTESAILHGVTK